MQWIITLMCQFVEETKNTNKRAYVVVLVFIIEISSVCTSTLSPVSLICQVVSQVTLLY